MNRLVFHSALPLLDRASVRSVVYGTPTRPQKRTCDTRAPPGGRFARVTLPYANQHAETRPRTTTQLIDPGSGPVLSDKPHPTFRKLFERD